MKLQVCFYLVVLLCLSALSQTNVSGNGRSDASAHIRIVDNTGAPVEGAVVSVSVKDRGRCDLVTDADGRIAVDTSGGTGCTIHHIKKGGYDCLARYFRLNRKFYANPVRNPYGKPRVIVVRKMEPEPEAVGAGLNWFLLVGNDRGCEPKPFSIFHPDLSKNKDGYVDVFVQPSCDWKKKEWVLSLWTTNVNSGIIATTNRVYSAPENGYRQRVDVAQADCLSPTFTLYLKTRPQGLYVMLPFFEDEIHACWSSNITNFQFWCRTVKINPYGERNLEVDTRYSDVMLDPDYKGILGILLEGKRPPRMDIPARVANRKRWWAAFKEKNERENFLLELETKVEKIQERINDKSQKEIDQELEPLRREIEAVENVLDKLEDEMERLDQELPTLNLPPGMTEKDKYGKVDMDLSDYD